MKRCPSCNSQYTDDTLQFCLQDGTPLVAGAQADTPTVVLNETETVVARDTAGQQSQVTHVATAMPTTANRSKTPAIVVAVVVVVFVMLAATAIGLALLRNFPGGDAAKNSNLANVNSNANKAFTPTPTPGSNSSASPTPTVTPGPNSNSRQNTPTDKEQAMKDIESRIDNWKYGLESHTLTTYMSCYSAEVNYYSAGSVPQSRVRIDKEKAMSMYSSIRVTVSNMKIEVNATNDEATAVFDKEWVFEGGGKRNAGKTRAELGLERVSNVWRINRERDQKVYYTQ